MAKTQIICKLFFSFVTGKTIRGRWISKISLLPLRIETISGFEPITSPKIVKLIRQRKKGLALERINLAQYRILQKQLDIIRKMDSGTILKLKPDDEFLLEHGYLEKAHIPQLYRNDQAIIARSQLHALEELENDFELFFSKSGRFIKPTVKSLEGKILNRLSARLKDRLVRRVEKADADLQMPPWQSLEQMQKILRLNEPSFVAWEEKFEKACQKYTSAKVQKDLSNLGIKKRNRLKYVWVKRRMEELRLADPELSTNDRIQKICEETGDSFEAVKAGFYYPNKKVVKKVR